MIQPPAAAVHSSDEAVRTLYLDLLKRSLTGFLTEDPPIAVVGPAGADVSEPIAKARAARAAAEGPIGVGFQAAYRAKGLDWPQTALTMVGLARLDNLQACIEAVVRDRIPGDVIETGVWRGGASIFMAGALRAFGAHERRVFVADSFEGMPPPNAEAYPADAGFALDQFNGVLAVSLSEVQNNFRRYALLDDTVHFVEGWFNETLPDLPTEQLSIVRLDGDLYESTWDALTNLYPRLSAGGFLIVDDYCLRPCREAVTEFRAMHQIEEPLVDIDGSARFWRKAHR